MFEPDIFRKQIHCIEESACVFVGTFRRPPQHLAKSTVILRPRSDSAPGQCAPLAPSRYAVQIQVTSCR